VVGAVAAAREAAEAEVVPRGAAEVEPAEVEPAEAEAAGPEGVAGALAAAAQEAAGPEGVAGQAPAVGAAKVAEEALPQSGPGAFPETRGFPRTPRLADASYPQEHSPSAGRHPCLSSV